MYDKSCADKSGRISGYVVLFMRTDSKVGLSATLDKCTEAVSFESQKSDGAGGVLPQSCSVYQFIIPFVRPRLKPVEA
jgi:hypothetical protein